MIIISIAYKPCLSAIEFQTLSSVLVDFSRDGLRGFDVVMTAAMTWVSAFILLICLCMHAFVC